MYWQLMPGESQDAVEREFFDWLNRIVGGAAELFPAKPEVAFPIRWLPGSAIPKSEPLVANLSACARKVLGCEPPIGGLDGPCDMYVFHQGFGIPAIAWGPRGGNTHGADEYLEVDSALAAAKSLLLFVCDWCGTANAGPAALSHVAT
jgi:acetylornithine deacetylase